VVFRVAFSPDGRLIAGCSWDGGRVWDVETGRELARLEAPEGTFDRVAVSLDGRIIVSGSQDGKVSVWLAGNGRELGPAEGHMKEIRCLAVSPDGRLVATGSRPRQGQSSSSGGTVQVWEVATGRELARVELDRDYVWGSGVWSVAFSSDGRLLAIVTDRVVLVLVAQEGRELARAEFFGAGGGGVAFSRDGRLLAAGSRDGVVGVWEATTGRELVLLERRNESIGRCSFTADGRLRFTGTDDAIRVWDTENGEQRARIGGHTGQVICMAFSPDGRLLATGTAQGELRVSETATGRELARMRGDREFYTCVAFSPDGRLIAAGSYGAVQLLEISTGREVLRMELHANRVGGLGFSPENRVDDLAFSPENRVDDLAFSPDGRRLVSSFPDETLRVWDTGSGACLATHRGSTDPEALARGDVGGPWTAITLPETAETTISPVAGGDPVAWFPVAFKQLKSQRSGRTWAGVVGNHVYLIRLEGVADSGR
jgi:WD40 repeat protein